MTYISIQTSQSTKKVTIIEPAILVQLAVCYIRTSFSVLFTKRPISADAILEAQARSEAARRSVDNLLR